MTDFERLLLLFCIFTNQFLIVRAYICPLKQKKITLVSIIWTLVGVFLFSKHSFLLLIWSLSSFVLIFFTNYQFQRQKRELLRSQLAPFLLKVSLSLKIGMSLREALRKESLSEAKYFQDVMADMLSALEKNQKIEFQAREFETFFNLIEKLSREPAKIVTRIDLLRKKLEIEQFFSAKMAQILSQPRAQAVIIAILYSLLILFLVFNFRFELWRSALLGSLPLFFLGQVFIFKLGRRYQWKV